MCVKGVCVRERNNIGCAYITVCVCVCVRERERERERERDRVHVWTVWMVLDV